MEQDDPFNHDIKREARRVDVASILESTEAGPLLGLFQFELITGASTEEAMASTIEQVYEAAEIVMGVLGFPPKAQTLNVVAKEAIDAGCPVHVFDAAIDYLLTAGKIEQRNGWYFKVPGPGNHHYWK